MRKKQAHKPPRFAGRVGLFFAVLLIVILVFVFSDTLRASTIQRLIYWVGSGVSGTTDSASISFAADSRNRFHLIQNELAVLSTDALHVYRVSGDEEFFAPLSYRSPTLVGSPKYLIAFDRSGLNYLVTNGNKILLQSETDAGITNANINRNGAFSLITDGTDCKSLLTIYSPSQEPIFKLHSTEQYLLDAVVSNNNRDVALLAFSAKSGVFEGSVSFYHLDENTPFATQALSDCTPLKAAYNADDELWVLCEDRFLVFDEDGKQTQSISFDNKPIAKYSFASQKLGAVLLDNTAAGGQFELLTLGSHGTEPGRIQFSEDALSVSTAGNYLAVQFSDKIVIYDETLSVFATLNGPSNARNCILREDGTVLVLGTNYARLLIP